MYIEVRLPASVDPAELLGRYFGREPEGTWESDGVLRIYWSAGRFGPENLDELRAAFGRLTGSPGPPFEVGAAEEVDWVTQWAESIRPIRIGRRILVRQSWTSAPVPDGGFELVLDPGQAFGTGHHATTQLALELLEETMQPGDEILDVGTGSGILAMAALRLGAGFAFGIDTDATAIECARGYAASNGFGAELQLHAAALEDLEPRRFGLVVANLDLRALTALARPLSERLRAGGHLIVSGLVVEDRDEAAAAFSGAGLSLGRWREREGWTAAALHRAFPPPADR